MLLVLSLNKKVIKENQGKQSFYVSAIPEPSIQGSSPSVTSCKEEQLLA